MVNIPTLPPGRVIDVRGSSAGLGKGIAALGKIVKGLTQSDEEKVDDYLVRNPGAAEELAAYGWRRENTMGRMEEAHRLKTEAAEQPLTKEQLEGGEKIELPETDLSDIDPEAVMLPTLPTGETVSEEKLQEIMAMHPESEEAAFKRSVEEITGEPVEETRAEEYVAEVEEAGEERELGGAQRRLKLLQTERETEIFERYAELVPGERVATTRATEAIVSEAQARDTLEELKLKGERRDRIRGSLESFYDYVYPNLSDEERTLFNTAYQGAGGQALLNLWSQERAYDRQAALRGIAESTNPKEVAMATFENVTKINKEVDRILGLMDQAVENDNEERLPNYIQQLRSHAQTLFMLDPSAEPIVADRVTGWLRDNKITGVEFSTTDIVETNPQAIEAVAQRFAKSDMGEEELGNLDTAIAAVFPGKKAEKAKELVLVRVSEIKDSGKRPHRAELLKAVEMSGIAGEAQTEMLEINENYENSLLRFNEALSSGTHDQVRSAYWDVTFARLVKAFVGTRHLPSRGEVY